MGGLATMVPGLPFIEMSLKLAERQRQLPPIYRVPCPYAVMPPSTMICVPVT